jgi:hypothetical protein
MNKKDEYQILKNIVLRETLYMRHYLGKVLDNQDPINKGRVKVALDDLGWSQGIWAKPRVKMSVPAVGKWVDVFFINNDKDRPVYLSIAFENQDMIPKNYDGQPTTHIIFEDNTNQVHIKYDETGNLMEIGNKNFDFAARINDSIGSDASTDATFWTWLTAAASVLTGLGVVAPTPTSLTGKISTGSDQIKVGKI